MYFFSVDYRIRVLFIYHQFVYYMLSFLSVANDPETQTKIITACMCLHNFIRDSKLYDSHFDTIERGSYIHEDSASYVGGNASSSSDTIMGALRQRIAESLVA